MHTGADEESLGAKESDFHAYGIEEMACVLVRLAGGAGACSRWRRGGMRHEDGHEDRGDDCDEDRNCHQQVDVASNAIAVRAAAAGRAGRPDGALRDIKSLARKSGRFEMRFDPAWWLTGVAAEGAAVEDKAISPGDSVPNDYYIVDEGHLLLTYVVAAKAPVTIVTAGAGHARISVSELAQLFSGKNPGHRALMAGGVRGFGFWIRVGDKYPNPVLSLDQQYQP